MFWDKFNRACWEKGISVRSAVDELGLSYGNVDKWKKGGSVRNSTLKRIADYFEKPITWFDEGTIPDKTATLETLREDQRLLFYSLKDATPDEVLRAAAIIEALKKTNGH